VSSHQGRQFRRSSLSGKIGHRSTWTVRREPWAEKKSCGIPFLKESSTAGIFIKFKRNNDRRLSSMSQVSSRVYKGLPSGFRSPSVWQIHGSTQRTYWKTGSKVRGISYWTSVPTLWSRSRASFWNLVGMTSERCGTQGKLTHPVIMSRSGHGFKRGIRTSGTRSFQKSELMTKNPKFIKDRPRLRGKQNCKSKE
jgi:hypothetical protein